MKQWKGALIVVAVLLATFWITSQMANRYTLHMHKNLAGIDNVIKLDRRTGRVWVWQVKEGWIELEGAKENLFSDILRQL